MYFESKILQKVKRKSEALKAKIALPHCEKWKIFLTGKQSFCKEAGEIFLWAKKELFAVENI